MSGGLIFSAIVSCGDEGGGDDFVIDLANDG